MKKRVEVIIAGQNYTLVGDEDAAYLQKVAAEVDEQVRQVMATSRVSLMDGAMLAAMDIADRYFKEKEAAENLRQQLKDYLEESAKTKLELADARREIFKLQNKK